jgi:hypothetical protein
MLNGVLLQLSAAAHTKTRSAWKHIGYLTMEVSAASALNLEFHSFLNSLPRGFPQSGPVDSRHREGGVSSLNGFSFLHAFSAMIDSPGVGRGFSRFGIMEGGDVIAPAFIFQTDQNLPLSPSKVFLNNFADNHIGVLTANALEPLLILRNTFPMGSVDAPSSRSSPHSQSDPDCVVEHLRTALKDSHWNRFQWTVRRLIDVKIKRFLFGHWLILESFKVTHSLPEIGWL